MASASLKALQDLLERDYAEVMRALDVLDRFLSIRGLKVIIENGDRREGDVQSPPSIQKVAGQPRSGRSLRERVDEVIAHDFDTPASIAAKSGLKVKQVRGVLYSPVLRDRYESKEIAGKMAFRLKK